jgi:hypothetical protein
VRESSAWRRGMAAGKHRGARAIRLILPSHAPPRSIRNNIVPDSQRLRQRADKELNSATPVDSQMASSPWRICTEYADRSLIRSLSRSFSYPTSWLSNPVFLVMPCLGLSSGNCSFPWYIPSTLLPMLMRLTSYAGGRMAANHCL